MRYVLDASVALKWELPEPDADKANRLRDDYRNRVHELIAPDSFVHPGSCPRSGQSRAPGEDPDAEKLWLDAMTTCPDLHPLPPLTLRAVQIARQARIGVYDCLYVALAERERCELLTADDRLVRTLQPMFLFITLLASLP